LANIIGFNKSSENKNLDLEAQEKNSKLWSYIGEKSTSQEIKTSNTPSFTEILKHTES